MNFRISFSTKDFYVYKYMVLLAFQRLITFVE